MPIECKRTMLSRGLRRFLECSAVLTATVLTTVALADTSVLERTVDVDIPAQRLTTAVFALSKQAGIQVLSSPDVLGLASTGGVHGHMTLRAALLTLLKGTQLGFHAAGKSTVGIDPAQATPAARPAPPAARDQEDSAGDAQGSAASAPNHGDQSGPSPSRNSGWLALDEVLVTGSRLTPIDGEGPVAVKVVTQDDIRKSGATNVTEVLNTLPEVSVSIQNSANQGQGFGTTVRLRGLPLGSTLVLLNGRRVGSSGMNLGAQGSFFDLDLIPVAAIDRIEILAQGASAVYGSDALAGVINILLKKDYDAAEVDTKYGGADGTNTKQADLAWGHRWSRGSVSVIGSYEATTPLAGAGRDITSTADFTRFGGPDRRSSGGNPANVYSTNGQNLPGLNATEAAIPVGSTGIGLTPANFAATAGVINNGYDYLPYQTLIPDSRRESLFASGSFQLTDSIELFAEALVSRVENEYTTVPLHEFSNLLVPASNAFNPFGTQVGVGTDYLFTGLGPGTTDQESTFSRPLLGLKGHFGSSWEWQISGWQSLETDNVSLAQISSSRLTTALASSDPAQAFDPFGGPGGSPALLQSLTYQLIEHYRTTAYFSDAYVRGSLFDLPAGPLDVVLGSDYEHENLTFAYQVPGDPTDAAIYATAGHNSTYLRTTYSAFAEARIPLLSAQILPAIGESLTATVAGRYDHYSDFGGTSNPQFGLQWRPSRELLFRADYSRSFQAPTLYELYSPRSPDQQSVIDPFRNNETVSAPVTFGGSRGLRPETGSSRSFGVLYVNPELLGLSLSLNQWTLTENNEVSIASYQEIVDDPTLFPGRVARGPAMGGTPGPITSVDDGYINFGRIDTAGLDYSAGLKLPTALGEFAPTLSASEVYRYKAALVPGSAQVNVLGSEILGTGGVFSPRWKATGSVSWTKDVYQAGLTARYIGRYLDVGGYPIGNDVFYDMFSRYDIGRVAFAANRFLSQASLSLGVVNLTNKLPSYAHNGTYPYDPYESDPRGRYVYGSLSVKF